MLNFTLMTEGDRREAAAIERRKILEEERKKRIFNPRTRLFGVDYEALEKQILEKKLKDEEEQRIDKQFDEERRKNDELAIAYAKQEDDERAKYLREINNFRQTYQRPEDRREFDLNDPDQYKRAIPARLHDDDPRCGISSVQKFEGEDLVSEQRLKIQQEQTKAWLDQQMQEKTAAEKEQKAAEDAYKAALIARDQRALEMDQMEKDCRKRLQEACRKFNLALAAEKDFQLKMKERQNIEDNHAEIYNIMTSDMMTENADAALSNLGIHRKIGSLYKGMSKEELENIRKTQLAQIAEKKMEKQQEERRDREYEDYINGTQKTISLMDQELNRQEKERQRKIAEENLRMAEEHKSYQNYLENIVYTNRPTAAYFDQFNRSTR